MATTSEKQDAAARETAAQDNIPQHLQGVDTVDLDRLKEKGTADIGWDNLDGNTPIPLLDGLQNDGLWLLARRFNKQTFRVRRLYPQNQDLTLLSGDEDAAKRAQEEYKQRKAVEQLDFNIGADEQFSPEKLRATLERVYMTIIVGFAAFFKHIARLGAWTEWKRSAFFTLLYFGTWAFNVLEPAFVLLLITLIISDRARNVLFPYAPLAAIDASTGKAKVPASGHLASSDSLTGGAEAYKGQAVEQEARNFVGALGTVAVSTAAGSTANKHNPHPDKDSDEEDEDEEDIDDPDTAVDKDDENNKKSSAKEEADQKSQDKSALKIFPSSQTAKTDAQPTAEGKDHTKEPMEKAMWKSLGPFLHFLNDATDTWERFANALEPTPPFARWLPRYRLAGVMVPIFCATMLARATLLYHGFTFSIGLGLFARPLFEKLKPEPILAWLDKHIPHWKRYLELRNSILRGVPTNAQVTITLLRIGEANGSPLPPPPITLSDGKAADAEPDKAHQKGVGMADHPDMPDEYRTDLQQKAAKLEVKAAEAEAKEQEAKEEAEAKEKDKQGGSKKKALFFGLLKGSAKIGVETLLGANRVKASAGSLHSKVRLGVVQDPKTAQRRKLGDGPISFRGRYAGKKGLLFISTHATTPCISFEQTHALTGKPKSATTEIKDKLEGKEEGQLLSKITPSALTSSGSSTPKQKEQDEEGEKVQQSAMFSIAIDDIQEIKKVGGLSWAGKLVVGWTLGSEVADGLEIFDSTGKMYKLTAVNRRDEVFNRLVAIGSQRWEML